MTCVSRALSSASTPTVPAPAPAPPKKPRVALWDNARFVLIVMVVIGHMISTVRTDTQLSFALYAFIYLFHMPAMILLSGVFSKPDTSPQTVRSTWQLLLVWGMWEAIWAGIHGAVEGQGPGKHFGVSPAWTLWFLVTLATLRILMPYLARLRRPLLFSVLVALGAGLLPAVGTEFSASRTLTFLPFFVAGWLMRDRGWVGGDWFMRPSLRVRAGAWAVFVLIATVFVWITPFARFWRIDKWLTWRDDYAWLFAHAPVGGLRVSGSGWVAFGGVAVTAVLMVIASVMTLALLLVVSRRHSFVTVWGTRTLYVYLLHGPIVWVLRRTGVIDELAAPGVAGVVVLVVLAFVLTVLLSLRWVPVVFRPVIEPKWEWPFRREL